MMTRQRVSPVEADVHRGKRAWGGRGVGVAIGMVARSEMRRLEGRADGRVREMVLSFCGIRHAPTPDARQRAYA